MKWEPPLLANFEERFSMTVLPPASNANYAFILTALEKSDQSILVLPNGVLSTEQNEEKEIRKYLIESNFIDTVIQCPDKMFEATNIPVVILILNKIKRDEKVMFVDLTDQFEINVREQKGQFGESSHTERVYKKEVKVFSEEIISNVADIVKNRTSKEYISNLVEIETIKNNDFNLSVNRYVERKFDTKERRSYKDIVNDLNRVIRDKNNCKLTINESLAKEIGLDMSSFESTPIEELNSLMKRISGEVIVTNNYIQKSKQKNEFKFENTSKEKVSSLLIMLLSTWKHHIYYLNTEENRYLAELRDALILDLMSGEIKI